MYGLYKSPIFGRNLQRFPISGNGFGPGIFSKGNASFHSKRPGKFLAAVAEKATILLLIVLLAGGDCRKNCYHPRATIMFNKWCDLALITTVLLHLQQYFQLKDQCSLEKNLRCVYPTCI